MFQGSQAHAPERPGSRRFYRDGEGAGCGRECCRARRCLHLGELQLALAPVLVLLVLGTRSWWLPPAAFPTP